MISLVEEYVHLIMGLVSENKEGFSPTYLIAGSSCCLESNTSTISSFAVDNLWYKYRNILFDKPELLYFKWDSN